MVTEGGKPKLVEFPQNFQSGSHEAVIYLTLVLTEIISKNKRTTFLYLTEEQPELLTLTIQLFNAFFYDDISYTENIEEFLLDVGQKKIFSSNFRSVNGMEFDHIVIFMNQSEYFLQFYLPQIINRCTYDLTFVSLPEGRNWWALPKFEFISSKKDTDTSMINQWIKESLVKCWKVVKCQKCKKDNNNSYCISNETDKMLIFGVHTDSDQYKAYRSMRKKLEKQRASSSVK